jgi:hypothetical protein
MRDDRSVNDAVSFSAGYVWGLQRWNRELHPAWFWAMVAQAAMCALWLSLHARFQIYREPATDLESDDWVLITEALDDHDRPDIAWFWAMMAQVAILEKARE